MRKITVPDRAESSFLIYCTEKNTPNIRSLVGAVKTELEAIEIAKVYLSKGKVEVTKEIFWTIHCHEDIELLAAISG